MIPSSNPNSILTPCELIERAARGEEAAISDVRKGLKSILIDNALRDFLRPHVIRGVRSYWKNRRREIRKHVTVEEAVEEVISNVLLAIHRNPSLLADGSLAAYAHRSAKHYVFDIFRWESRETKAFGQRSPMTSDGLRTAVLENFVESREEAKHLISRVLRVLGPTRMRALFNHYNFGPHAWKQKGTGDGSLSHSRRRVREEMADDADKAR